MNDSWYKNLLPKIKDIENFLSLVKEESKKSSSIKNIYAWGELSKKYSSKEDICKDIDIVFESSLVEDDLLSIIEGKNSPLKIKADLLLDLGFNPEAVSFTKDIIKIMSKNNLNSCLNIWALSKDKKILHWGLIPEDKNEWDEIKEDASKYASQKNNENSSWLTLYNHHVNKFSENTPKGWYSTNNQYKKIQKELIKI